jgi:hypothetical protein
MVGFSKLGSYIVDGQLNQENLEAVNPSYTGRKHLSNFVKHKVFTSRNAFCFSDFTGCHDSNDIL